MRDERIRFMLDGCDIAFVAEAPKDITLEQLLNQTSRIKPDWCACGIRHLYKAEHNLPVEIFIDYDKIGKMGDAVPCTIRRVENDEK